MKLLNDESLNLKRYMVIMKLPEGRREGQEKGGHTRSAI